MTRDEFFEKYGTTKLKFISYYKFTFTFTGTAEDGLKITAGFGGNSDDIYREEVTRDAERPLGTEGDWHLVDATRDGKVVFSDYWY